MSAPQSDGEEDRVLPADVPVSMPELPIRFVVNTAQQFKALGDPIRWQILNIIQNQPATAKQIADTLKIAPGTAGHHLQVLEAAGLAQVTARRLVHGIVAKYYTRTARIFQFDYPPEIKGNTFISLDILRHARDEMAESLATGEDDDAIRCGFPHMRLAPERAQIYGERLSALLNDFLHETPDPAGQVYGLSLAFFKSPPYMQAVEASEDVDISASDEDE